MKKMRLLALLALTFCANIAFAQNIRVSGTVSDQAGIPLIGVVVSVQGTTIAAATDVDGIYNLSNVPTNGALEYRYAGMKTPVIEVGGRSTIDMVMEEDAIQADAVVVTALGVKRPTKALGYAVQEVSGETLLNKRTVNVTSALDGQIAGLQVVKGGGPGGSSKIILRGQSSLSGNNQPLVVVDGIPMDNFSGGDGDNGADYWGINSGVDFGSGINDINPEDIEAMTVLKGASAAALYGSRAGNGVILITTKSGRASPGLGITVSGGISIENILVQPEMQNSFGQGFNGANIVEGETGFIRSSWGAAVGTPGQVWDKAAQGWVQGNVQTYDNNGAFFRTGVIDTESITFQQQINRTSVYASINRMNDKNMIPETELNRTSISARATTNLGEGDKWKLDFKINYINNKAKNRPIQGNNQSNTFFTLNTLPRSLNITDFNPSYREDGSQIWWDTENNSQNNPYWMLQRAQNHDERNRFIGFTSLAYKFTDWLSLELKGGMDYYSTFMYKEQYAGSLAGQANGNYTEATNTFLEANYSFLLIAQKDNIFGKFGGSLTLGGNMMDQTRRSIDANSGELLIPDVFSLNNGIDKPTVNSSNIHRKMNSLYGSLSLNWNRAIYLDATLRNDWSSTMSRANMSYMYPSISTSIVISDLVNAMPTWFNFAKVRASYAEVGNDLDPYQLYTNYTINSSIIGGNTAERGDILFDNNVRSELISSYEVGAELRFLESRLRLDVAWYKTNATRQLLDIPLDPSSGYVSKKINAGNIENQGVEISLGATAFRNPDGFNWDMGVNFTHNRTFIKELQSGKDGIKQYNIVDPIDGDIYVLAKEGGLYGDMYGSTYRRVDEEGSQYYGQLLLDANGLPVKVGTKPGDEMSYLGNQQPDFLIGFNSSMSWKGINLDFTFDAKIGGVIWSQTVQSIHKMGNAAATAPGGVRENFVVGGVVSDGNGGYSQNTTAVSHQDYWNKSLGQNNIGIAEAYTYDATSVRLRNLSIGYTLPQKVLAGTGLQRVKFSVTGYNLWLIYSAIPGVDPESVSATNTNATGLDLGVPPTTQSFTFNITLGF